ncbi:MAG: metallophosphoesterase [Acidobacteriota bacterium]|nr:metallophosphoesterase [Acidobacteriota bacterium]
MKTIAHISDLHFGRVDPATLEPLRRAITELSPDLVVVTGDLTQRARRRQFQEVREFLDTLPRPQIVVPGNHDVPLYRVLARFHHPFRLFRRYITDDLEPWYSDDELAVVGINTARSWTTKFGRVNRDQARRAHARFRASGPGITRIVATHHPFDLPEGANARDIVGRARMAMEVLAECGTDLFLAGHVHRSHSGQTAARYRIAGHSALFLTAGTATSTRARGETNSFNWIRIAKPLLDVRRYTFLRESETFVPLEEQLFEHTEAGWAKRQVIALTAP